MDWQTLRNQFMRDTGGDLPGNQLEQQLIDAYTEHPAAVERSIEKITLGFKAGKIRSPWGALKAEVSKAVHAVANPTHDRGAKREQAIQRAEQRIRNELFHYEREDEVRDELFGPRGTLRDHHTPALQQRLIEMWADLAPLGAIVEQEAIERGNRYQEQRATQTETQTPGNLNDQAA
jgi:hypothetical protein